MIIKLSKAEVELKDNLNFGDTMKITRALGNGSSDTIIDAQYVVLEVSIVKIIEDGKEFKYSKNWVDNLTKEDGELLCTEADSLVTKKKD